MPLPGTIIWVVFVLGLVAASTVPVLRWYPDVMEGKIYKVIAEYDQKVIAFAHRAERVLLCSPGGKLGKASKETIEAFDQGDLDKDGLLSVDEISFGLMKLNVEKITLEHSLAMLAGGDTDNDDKLTKEEFHCVAGHASTLYAKALRYLGACFAVLAVIAFPPCGYFGLELMHDEFGAGKNYTWTLVPLGILFAGMAYASTEGMNAILPFITSYAAMSIFVLTFYGLSGMLFLGYCFITTYKWKKA